MSLILLDSHTHTHTHTHREIVTLLLGLGILLNNRYAQDMWGLERLCGEECAGFLNPYYSPLCVRFVCQLLPEQRWQFHIGWLRGENCSHSDSINYSYSHFNIKYDMY